MMGLSESEDPPARILRAGRPLSEEIAALRARIDTLDRKLDTILEALIGPPSRELLEHIKPPSDEVQALFGEVERLLRQQGGRPSIVSFAGLWEELTPEETDSLEGRKKELNELWQRWQEDRK